MNGSQDHSTRTEHTLDAASLRFRVNLLGCAALAGYAALTLLSYVQAPALWRAENATQMLAFFDNLTQRLPILGLYQSFPSNMAVIWSYWGPLALATLASLLLVLVLSRRSTAPDEDLVRLIFNWSLVFAAACALAFPVFTQDMWLSAVWGRMTSAGVNPYYNIFTPDTIQGLPLDHFPMVMSYGPLWAVLSAVVTLLAGDSTLAIGVLFKVLLAIAWLASLWLVERITRGLDARERSLSVGMFGWTPAGVSQSLAEGHNDIALVALLLLWLHLMLRGNWVAPLALAASALCKYVSAPLMLVDAIYAVRRRNVSIPQFLARYALPGFLVFGTLSLFYRSTAFFDGLKVVSEWQFLRPSEAFMAIEHLTGLPMLVPRKAAMAFFVLLAIYWLAVCYWSPTNRVIQKTAIAVMVAVLFAGVSHVWPWYVIWALALAVLVPGWWLSRFVFGLSLLMPFALAAWWIEPVPNHMEHAALILYAGACLWTFATRERHS